MFLSSIFSSEWNSFHIWSHISEWVWDRWLHHLPLLPSQTLWTRTFWYSVHHSALQHSAGSQQALQSPLCLFWGQILIPLLPSSPWTGNIINWGLIVRKHPERDTKLYNTRLMDSKRDYILSCSADCDEHLTEKRWFVVIMGIIDYFKPKWNI